MGVTKGNNPMSRQEKRAWDYVAYKTIKIFWNYKHYEEAWNNLDGDFDSIRSQLDGIAEKYFGIKTA